MRNGLGFILPQWFDDDPYQNGFNAINSAVLAATNNSQQNQHNAVFIPPGIYRIDRNNVFGNGGLLKSGLRVVGAGMMNTILLLETDIDPIWFYDNAELSDWAFASFSDIGFVGVQDYSGAGFMDINGNANGFRIRNDGNLSDVEQGFRFNRCLFSCLGTAINTESESGDNASEMSFLQCKFHKIKNTVYKINNQQSFNHEFYGTDIEAIYGDVFDIERGGGAIRVRDCSIITFSDSGEDQYVLKVKDGAGIGSSGSPVLFDGVRFELRGNKTNLANIENNHGDLNTIFRSSTFWSTATGVKNNWVNLGYFGSIAFDGCSWAWANKDFSERYNLISTARYGMSGDIIFNNCLVHENLPEHIVINNFGSASSRNCRLSNYGAVTSDPRIIAVDFDLTGSSNVGMQTLFVADNQTSPKLKIKSVPVMFSPYFPYNGIGESTVKLPPKSIIKNIHVFKEAQGESTQPYKLHVGNNDKSIIYGSSTSCQMKDSHSINVKPLTNCDGDRIVRLWSDGGDEAHSGGFAILEYY